LTNLEFTNLGWLALRPCHAVAYDMQTEMSSPPTGELPFAYWPLRDRQTFRHFNINSKKSQEKRAKKLATDFTPLEKEKVHF